MEKMVEKFWYKVARTFAKAGGYSFPITDAYIELMQALLTEEQAKFILIFKKPKLNIDQLKAKTDLDEKSLLTMLHDLIHIGIITGIPSRRTGIMVYTLIGLVPGILGSTFMKGTTGEREINLAHKFENLFSKTTKITQNNYDNIIDQYRKFPPFDRIVPVEKMIDIQQENILPYEDVKKLIETFDLISIGTCYCRHQKELLNDQCKRNAPKLTCFFLGRNAQFAIEHGAKQISKKDALFILKEAENQGLVHKVFHANLNLENVEATICNCCKCCCITFQSYYRGMAPISSLTSYIANVDKDICIGCSTCVNICPTEAAELLEMISVINQNKCIGCGLCAYHCPEKAIKLERTGPRNVFISPPRIEQIKNIKV